MVALLGSVNLKDIFSFPGSILAEMTPDFKRKPTP